MTDGIAPGSNGSEVSILSLAIQYTVIVLEWVGYELLIMSAQLLIDASGNFFTTELTAREYASSHAVSLANFRLNVSHLIPFGLGNHRTSLDRLSTAET